MQKILRKLSKRLVAPYRHIVRALQTRRGERTSFLRKCKGLIHVGANAGQERQSYHRLGLRVLWIEPIPHVFDALAHNLIGYAKQRALKALVTNQDDVGVELQISSNGGKSSSILPLAEHAEVWPDIDFNEKIMLQGVTLPTALLRNDCRLEDYDALLLDTQGAELMILQGAKSILRNFKFIQAEAANFEAYVGCPQLDDIVNFMTPLGFVLDPNSRPDVAPGVRSHFDLLFQRQGA